MSRPPDPEPGATGDGAREGGTGRDAIALEARLARLPPARPCLRCPSRNRKGELVLISPHLEKTWLQDGDADAAVFTCRLCGADRVEPLGRF